MKALRRFFLNDPYETGAKTLRSDELVKLMNADTPPIEEDSFLVSFANTMDNLYVDNTEEEN